LVGVREQHGAWVSQFIADKTNFSSFSNVDLHVYEAGIPDTNHIDDVTAWQAIQSACDHGQKIINASVGTNKSWDREHKYFIQLSENINKLALNGCLLVHAAGNVVVRRKIFIESYHAIDKLYLTVGATRQSGGATSFSDAANLYAPGENLGVVVTQPGPWDGCEPSNMKLVSGTSFSASITSSVAANVYEILNSSVRLQQLPSVRQVKLEVRILTSFGKNLDGFGWISI
jgi:hypothetical protein